MRGARQSVAAALGGVVVLALVLAALAFGAGSSSTALVTLQLAPRGPGTVSATPTSADGNSVCTGQDSEDDCDWTYEQGTSVELRATPDGGPGQSFVRWSDLECGSSNPCTVKLDEDLTSIVAIFTPLMLAVNLSENPGGATVAYDPAGQECDPEKRPDDADVCHAFAPGTRVRLTVTPATNFTRWTDQGQDGYTCTPTGMPTCTIVVDDQPTWTGAVFGDDEAPPLATTITVEFKLRRSGNGSGRVTAPKMDCGTVCKANYGFGKTIALTATADDGSTFDGWNGVCAKTQTTCTFPAGPITSIRAVFTRDAAAPSAPGAPTVRTRTRTTVSIAWTASTDNVGVTGYRVYVNDAAAGETQGTEYALEGLKCGRTYAIAVDAVDAVGNRSQRATSTIDTRPCALAARLAGVRVRRVGRARTVVVTLRANRTTTVRLRLLRRGRVVALKRFPVRPGTNTLLLRVPRALRGGPYRLTTVLVDPDGGTLALGSRGVLIPRP